MYRYVYCQSNSGAWDVTHRWVWEANCPLHKCPQYFFKTLRAWRKGSEEEVVQAAVL